jgi:hypothetical protein
VGYLPGMWHDFGTTVGGLAGALTGLLFVAVSIKSDILAKSVSLRSRAAQTLVLFVDALGGELVALALLSGTALYVFDRRGGHDRTSRVARYIEQGSPNTITPVFFGVAGITLLLSAGGGLYWLIPAAICSLAGGVVNAWLFLVRA